MDVRCLQLSPEPNVRALGRTLGGVVGDLRNQQRAERDLDRAQNEEVDASDYLTALLDWAGDFDVRRTKRERTALQLGDYDVL